MRGKVSKPLLRCKLKGDPIHPRGGKCQNLNALCARRHQSAIRSRPMLGWHREVDTSICSERSSVSSQLGRLPTNQEARRGAFDVRLSPNSGAKADIVEVREGPQADILVGSVAVGEDAFACSHSGITGPCDLTRPPFLCEERFKRTVEAQDREPALFRIGLNPVAALGPGWLRRTEVDRRGVA
jgi:hypothetical protein